MNPDIEQIEDSIENLVVNDQYLEDRIAALEKIVQLIQSQSANASVSQ